MGASSAAYGLGAAYMTIAFRDITATRRIVLAPVGIAIQVRNKAKRQSTKMRAILIYINSFFLSMLLYLHSLIFFSSAINLFLVRYCKWPFGSSIHCRTSIQPEDEFECRFGPLCCHTDWNLFGPSNRVESLIAIPSTTVQNPTSRSTKPIKPIPDGSNYIHTDTHTDEHHSRSCLRTSASAYIIRHLQSIRIRETTIYH